MYFVYFSKEKRFANSDWLAGDVSVFSAFVKKKERAHVKKNDFIVLVKGLGRVLNAATTTTS